MWDKQLSHPKSTSGQLIQSSVLLLSRSYNGQGNCVHVPQLREDQAIPTSYKVQSYKCAERYGYIWVCLDNDPLLPIPYIREAEDPKNRLIPQFDEPWQCSGLRVMENSFDNAHFSFVHAASFGNQEQPLPASSELIPLEFGLLIKYRVPVVNPLNNRKTSALRQQPLSDRLNLLGICLLAELSKSSILTG